MPGFHAGKTGVRSKCRTGSKLKGMRYKRALVIERERERERHALQTRASRRVNYSPHQRYPSAYFMLFAIKVGYFDEVDIHILPAFGIVFHVQSVPAGR